MNKEEKLVQFSQEMIEKERYVAMKVTDQTSVRLLEEKMSNSWPNTQSEKAYPCGLWKSAHRIPIPFS